MSQRSKAEAENKAAESAGEKASVRGKYWRPDLNRSEWNLLNRRLEEEIESSGQYLDESTKWLYADEKGVQVFALYGIGDGTEATPLYAVGGKKAAEYNVSIVKYLEGKENVDRSTINFDRWFKSRKGTGVDQGGSILYGERRRSDNHADGGIHRGSSRRAGRSIPERSAPDQRGVKEKFHPVEETKNLLALHNNDEESITSQKTRESRSSPSFITYWSNDGLTK